MSNKIPLNALNKGIITAAVAMGVVFVAPAATHGDPKSTLTNADASRANAMWPAAEAAVAQAKRKRFRRFFNFPQIGDGCGNGDETVPNMWFFPERSEIRTRSDGEVLLGEKPFAVCYAGFDPDQPIAWLFDWPDGQSSREVVSPDALGPTWTPEPGMPLGLYKVTAEQGVHRATGTLTVKHPKFGIINAIEDGQRIGESFRLALLGFPPSTRVQVAVYRATDRRKCPGQRKPPEAALPFCLTTTRLRVRVDERGDAIRTYIAARPTYRPNSYLFAARDRRTFAISWQFAVCPRGEEYLYCLG